jgi:ribonuclease HI
MKRVMIHTDGGCKGNPGPGGFGVVMTSGGHRKEVSA